MIIRAYLPLIQDTLNLNTAERFRIEFQVENMILRVNLKFDFFGKNHGL